MNGELRMENNVNIKALFDTLKLDYKNYTIMFDITNFEHEGQQLYKLQKREVKKKQKV